MNDLNLYPELIKSFSLNIWWENLLFLYCVEFALGSNDNPFILAIIFLPDLYPYKRMLGEIKKTKKIIKLIDINFMFDF